jgi:hypothetical protein
METCINSNSFWYATFCNSKQSQKEDARRKLEGKDWSGCE